MTPKVGDGRWLGLSETELHYMATRERVRREIVDRAKADALEEFARYVVNTVDPAGSSGATVLDEVLRMLAHETAALRGSRS